VLAIVVDLRHIKQAAVKVFNQEKEFEGMVGMEHKSKLVIIPWTFGWSYFCVGDLTVGHVSALPRNMQGKMNA
jgi:hypothetical protein